MKKYTVEQLKEMVQEVNSWDGSLGDYDYMEIEQINELFHSVEPLEILRMAHFGEFDWNDDYFIVNDCGNLDSINEFEFEELLKDNQAEITERYNELIESGEIEDIL